jgi:electron transport complex protein RnfC
MDFSSLIKKLTGKHWGVHPADHKRPAADQPVHAVPLPQRLHLMLSQHVGAAARRWCWWARRSGRAS